MAIEYEPMEEPKRVSFQRMQEILQRRCKQATENLTHLKREMWFVDRLSGNGKSVFLGDTTLKVRADRVRSLLKNSLMAERRCGRRDGKDVTFAQMFAEVYGEAL